jgi:hypothetical protein
MDALWRAPRAVLNGFVALLILFEEWGWEPLQRALGRLARLPPLAALERRIARLPPYGALAVFAVPSVALVPVKVAALWLIGKGHVALGAAVVVLAKLIGTALLARLFLLTRPALLRLAWFARAYAAWTAWKEALLARVRASWPWRAARATKRMVRRAVRRWWARHRRPTG